jgi:hypothetical protein
MFKTWNMRSMWGVKNQDMWFVQNSYPLRPSSNPLRDPLYPSRSSYLNLLLSCNLPSFTCFSLRNAIVPVFLKEMLFYLFFTKKCYFTCFSQRNVILLVFHKEMLFYLFFTKKCYFVVAYFLEKLQYCTCTLYLCTLVAVRKPMSIEQTRVWFGLCREI